MYLLDFVSYRMTKRQLLNLIRPFSAPTFAKEINPIIAQSRGITVREAKFLSYLQSNEVVSFMEGMGFPMDNMGKHIVFEGMTITKKKLRAKINAMSQPEFDEKLSAVVAEQRNKDVEKIKCCQYLRYNEVVSFLLGIGEVLPKKEQDKLIVELV